MNKLKVNDKTSILFCIVLLDFVSGSPHLNLDGKNERVVSKIASDVPSDISKDTSLFLTRLRRHSDDSEEGSEDETSDNAGSLIESRFGFHGHDRRHRGFQHHGFISFNGGADKFTDFHKKVATGLDHLFSPHHGQGPHFELLAWGHHGTGGHDAHGFDQWNNGHNNNHGFGYNPGHGHQQNCGPYHNGAFGHDHNHGHQHAFGHDHNHGHQHGFENQPSEQPEFNNFPTNKPPGGFGGNIPHGNNPWGSGFSKPPGGFGENNNNGPWDGGFANKVDTTTSTTTQKTTTLPQIDIRLGDQ